MDIIIARPPPADNQIAYTSAVWTIAAQLTEISSESDENRLAPVLTGTINTSETALAGQVGKQETPTETLPPTSTSPATKTPAPSLSPTSQPTKLYPPSPLPVLNPEDPKAILGKPVWRDHFDDAMHWSLYNYEHVEMERNCLCWQGG